MNNKLLLIRVSGVLSVAVIVVALWMTIVALTKFERVDKLPGGFKGRMVALEFATSPKEVDDTRGPNIPANTAVMEELLSIDFAWIVCYTLLFIVIARLLSKRSCPFAKYLGWVALLSGFGAAVFDVRENLRILALLHSSPVKLEMIFAVRDATLTKWTLIFAALTVMAVAFMDLANKIATAIAAAYLATAILGIASLWYHPLLDLVGVPLLGGLVLLSITAFAWPNKLIEPSGCS